MWPARAVVLDFQTSVVGEVEILCLVLGLPTRERPINCSRFSSGLPCWLGAGAHILRGARLVEPGEEMALGEPDSSFQYLWRGYQEDGAWLFTAVRGGRMRDSCHQLKQGKFKLHVRKSFLTVRAIKQWNKLPSEAVQSPSLQVFKTRLDKVLSSLV